MKNGISKLPVFFEDNRALGITEARVDRVEPVHPDQFLK